MPQLAQLPDVFWSQLFWLAIVFGIIFFGIGLGMLPKIESTVEARDSKIADDLASAAQARERANEIEAAWRARLDESRTEALRVTERSRQQMARDAEARIKAADDEIRGRSEAAEARIREAAAAALGDIENVAAEAAQDLVSKLAGASVSRDRAVQAVKAALNG
jgi:F-type H+-transporting ATPase subunit b